MNKKWMKNVAWPWVKQNTKRPAGTCSAPDFFYKFSNFSGKTVENSVSYGPAKFENKKWMKNVAWPWVKCTTSRSVGICCTPNFSVNIALFSWKTVENSVR